MWSTTATRSAQVSRSPSVPSFSKKGPSRSSISHRQHPTSSPFLWDGRPMARGSDATITHASFLQTLFSGGGGSKSKSNEVVEELLSEVMELIQRRDDKAMVGEIERVEAIVEEIARFKIPRSPARSPLLPGTYAVRYLSRPGFPPFGTKPTFTISDSFETIGRFEMKEFGVFPASRARIGTAKVLSSDTVRTKTYKRVSEGIFGSKTEDDSFEVRDQILYLDERVLVIRRTPVYDEETPGKTVTQIYERLLSEGEAEPIEDEDQGVQSSISVGGLPGLKRKEGPETQAERSYQSKTGPASKGTTSRTDATKREAREEALRRQKEKANAEKEAALALKAEIKSSVEGFNQRLKEAQENKKEALAALRAFERENGDALKEVVAFRQSMKSMDDEIARLVEETFNMTTEEKRYAQEIKECRQELTVLERKLAAF